ncbi:glutathione S-transferase family protein [Novosphingobium sp. BL-8A]|uniref:glutathione S-transferase family protein n=1 Tax=Novosphingobium sp. BL-8A TaxID=3127639 RepID=UPI00375686FB
MPVCDNAATVVSGFNNVPPPVRGVVRDLRIRWALEEIGRDYRMELFDAMTPRSDEYREWQPFAQVPAFDDGEIRMFESGAILLYLGEQDPRLLPIASATRWQAITWLFAGMNSVEPHVLQINAIDIFYVNEAWAAQARPGAVKLAEKKLAVVEKALADRDWLAGPFTIADILMVTVLRCLDHTDMLAAFPALAAYKARAEARPAFRRALTEQLEAYSAPAGE